MSTTSSESSSGYSSGEDTPNNGRIDPPALQFDVADEEIPATPKVKLPKIISKGRPPIKKNPALAKLRSQGLKAHSTSSLFIEDTISNPDVVEVIHCCATTLHWVISKNASIKKPKTLKIYDEKLHPLTPGTPDTSKIPSIRSITNFLAVIFRVEQLAPEAGVMALAYVDRLTSRTGLVLQPINWRRVLIGALLIASKVWEEAAVWNADFLAVFPSVKVEDLNNLERHFLRKLNFEVTITATEYAKCYFELRSVSERDSSRQYTLKPIKDEDLRILEGKIKTPKAYETFASVAKSKSTTPNLRTNLSQSTPQANRALDTSDPNPRFLASHQ
mmetsp:Transcript_30121/g.33647  ORF Transcript_30121/g.33647 Transcript_30121/m.33647 type:complete len:331 (-) Transcript_30121:127-1119(-)